MRADHDWVRDMLEAIEQLPKHPAKTPYRPDMLPTVQAPSIEPKP